MNHDTEKEDTMKKAKNDVIDNLTKTVETFIRNYLEITGLTIDDVKLCQTVHYSQEGQIIIETWFKKKRKNGKYDRKRRN